MGIKGQRAILLEFMKNQIKFNELITDSLDAVSVGGLFSKYHKDEAHELMQLQETNINTLREIMEKDS